MAQSSIIYREFWDVPRIFVATYNVRHYLFECLFDDELDDYPERYRVYQMPALTDAQLQGSWENLAKQALCSVRTVPVSAVRFDPTKRASIDTAVFQALRAEPSGLALSA